MRSWRQCPSSTLPKLVCIPASHRRLCPGSAGRLAKPARRSSAAQAGDDCLRRVGRTACRERLLPRAGLGWSFDEQRKQIRSWGGTSLSLRRAWRGCAGKASDHALRKLRDVPRNRAIREVLFNGHRSRRAHEHGLPRGLAIRRPVAGTPPRSSCVKTVQNPAEARRVTGSFTMGPRRGGTARASTRNTVGRRLSLWTVVPDGHGTNRLAAVRGHGAVLWALVNVGITFWATGSLTRRVFPGMQSPSWCARWCWQLRHFPAPPLPVFEPDQPAGLRAGGVCRDRDSR